MNNQILSAQKLIKILKSYGTTDKAKGMSRFFKTGKGEYGEGDIFLGVKMPELNEIAKNNFANIDMNTIEGLILSEYHEARMLGIILLKRVFVRNKKNPEIQEKCVSLYLSNINSFNNWDLVDLSCKDILGPWLENRDRKLLYDLAESNSLWKERIAIITTLYFIKKDDYTDTLILSDMFINHKHDLMQKATGWMLREIGKRNIDVLKNYLSTRYKSMPRTMLRYAIEKFDTNERKLYLEGKI